MFMKLLITKKSLKLCIVLIMSIMKNLFLLVILLFSLIGNSQDSRIGIKGGLNYASLIFDDIDGNPEYEIDYHFGVMAEIPISIDEFSFQMELIYSRNRFKFLSEDFQLNYLTLPLLAKFYRSEALSIEFGPYFSYLIDAGDFNNYVSNDLIRKIDFGLCLGLGFELESGINLSVRYNMGLRSSVSPARDFVEFKRYNSLVQLSLGYFFK